MAEFRSNIQMTAPLKEATLFVFLSASECGECGANADPKERRHLMRDMQGEGCGALFTAITTPYIPDGDIHESIQAMRPDLPFVFPPPESYWERED